jgi:hypothetical protein
VGREKGKYGLQPNAVTSNPVRSVTIHGSNQCKETAIGKTIRFKNIQRRKHSHSVNPATKVSIFRHRGPCLFNESLPVTHDTRFFDSDSNRLKECAIVRLHFAGNIQGFGETCPKGGLQVADCPRLLIPNCERQEAIILKARPASPASSGRQSSRIPRSR